MQADSAGQVEEAASGVGRDTLILMAGFVGSRLAGLVRDIVIGRTFGTSRQLDAYLAAFRIPDLVFQLLAGAALGSAFIPVFARRRVAGDEEDAWRLASAVLNLLALATLVVAGAAFVAAPALVPLLAPGFSLAEQDLALGLTRIMLLSPVFFSASGVIMAILQARHRFWLPALAPTAYNLAIIAGALWLSPGMGIDGLAVGVALGAALHFLVQLPGLGRAGMRYRLGFDLNHPGVKEVGQLMLPRVLGLGVVQLNFVVITILASMLAPGRLAALNYAWVLTVLPLGVLGVAPAAALFPTMAEQAARGDWTRLNQTVSQGLRQALFLAVPASLALILLAEPLVSILFERGQFGAASTAATAWALPFYALGLPAHVALETVSRGFYAQRDTRTPVALGATAMGLNLVLGMALMRFLDHGGLALSLSISTIAETAALFLIFDHRSRLAEAPEAATSLVDQPARPLGRPAYPLVSPYVVQMGLAATALVATLLGWQWAVRAGGAAIGPWLQVVGGLGLGGATYLAVAWLLGNQEVRYAVAALARFRFFRSKA